MIFHVLCILELECLGNLCIQYVYDFAKGVVYIVVDLFIGKPFVDVHEIMLGEGGFSCFYSLLMDVRRFLFLFYVLHFGGSSTNKCCVWYMYVGGGGSMSLLALSFASACFFVSSKFSV